MAKKKVVLIDDETEVTQAVSHLLVEDGFQVFASNSGEEGVSLALRMRPDLIILDVLMEPMSGWEVCRILRRMPETSHIPVLMLTGRNAVKDKILAMQVGANDYLEKPFRNELLKERVERLLKCAVEEE